MLHQNLLADLRLHYLPLSKPMHDRYVILVLDEQNENPKVIVLRYVEQFVVGRFQLRSELRTWHDDHVELV